MKPDAYNNAELIAGRITMAHLTELVRLFQDAHGLTPDGMLGPKTRAELEAVMPKTATPTGARFLSSPLPMLSDGRIARITSAFRTNDRPDHNGSDFFYPWEDGDEPAFVGDKGCAGKLPSGKPKWVVPYGTCAIAAAGGKVQIAGNSLTGFRLWIDHGNGFRTGYFHLLDLRVAVGQIVRLGDELGLVGDNPADHDGRHLHFELSPVDRYAPIDPGPHLI